VDALPGVHGAVLGLPGETGLERFRLAHRALPGRGLAEVSLRTFASAHVEALLEGLRMAVWSTGASGAGDLTPGHLRMPDAWRPLLG
jgi:hypothetical protein